MLKRTANIVVSWSVAGDPRFQTFLATTNKGGRADMDALPNVVLVHGGWADGSSWAGVIERLQADGYNVTAPQFPMTTLAADVARLRQVLTRQIDQAIPPDAERLFAKRAGAVTVEVPSSHVAMVSHPADVAKLIETAAQAVPIASEPVLATR